MNHAFLYTIVLLPLMTAQDAIAGPAPVKLNKTAAKAILSPFIKVQNISNNGLDLDISNSLLSPLAPGVNISGIEVPIQFPGVPRQVPVNSLLQPETNDNIIEFPKKAVAQESAMKQPTNKPTAKAAVRLKLISIGGKLINQENTESSLSTAKAAQDQAWDAASSKDTSNIVPFARTDNTNSHRRLSALRQASSKVRNKAAAAAVALLTLPTSSVFAQATQEAVRPESGGINYLMIAMIAGIATVVVLGAIRIKQDLIPPLKFFLKQKKYQEHKTSFIRRIFLESALFIFLATLGNFITLIPWVLGILYIGVGHIFAGKLTPSTLDTLKNPDTEETSNPWNLNTPYSIGTTIIGWITISGIGLIHAYNTFQTEIAHFITDTHWQPFAAGIILLLAPYVFYQYFVKLKKSEADNIDTKHLDSFKTRRNSGIQSAIILASLTALFFYFGEIGNILVPNMITAIMFLLLIKTHYDAHKIQAVKPEDRDPSLKDKRTITVLSIYADAIRNWLFFYPLTILFLIYHLFFYTPPI